MTFEEFVQDQLPASDVTADPATRHAEHMAMLSEIGRLPKRQRAVLVLRHYEDRSDAEIAELLRCSQSSVRAYASRALATLRIEMRPGRPEPPLLTPHLQGDL